MIKKQKRLEHAHAVPGTQLLLCFLVVVYFAMMFSITLFSREPGSRTGVDVKLFETWGNQWLPDRYFVENILLFSAVRRIAAGGGSVSSERMVLRLCGRFPQA